MATLLDRGLDLGGGRKRCSLKKKKKTKCDAVNMWLHFIGSVGGIFRFKHVAHSDLNYGNAKSARKKSNAPVNTFETISKLMPLT